VNRFGGFQWLRLLALSLILLYVDSDATGQPRQQQTLNIPPGITLALGMNKLSVFKAVSPTYTVLELASDAWGLKSNPAQKDFDTFLTFSSVGLSQIAKLWAVDAQTMRLTHRVGLLLRRSISPRKPKCWKIRKI
jgi:hypothetical protein